MLLRCGFSARTRSRPCHPRRRREIPRIAHPWHVLCGLYVMRTNRKPAMVPLANFPGGWPGGAVHLRSGLVLDRLSSFCLGTGPSFGAFRPERPTIARCSNGSAFDIWAARHAVQHEEDEGPDRPEPIFFFARHDREVGCVQLWGRLCYRRLSRDRLTDQITREYPRAGGNPGPQTWGIRTLPVLRALS
ncbi:hypothetical protein F5148DRAFT_939022 [Russula earlei]|uniref:Uncharacterized protein n=1 Tax=Russula earlei TaxID=71964 RepID=A0ACC0U9U4_9AGAM|nr:hypothetical protein F5148DRAFT_939022 [Russula earlei]